MRPKKTIKQIGLAPTKAKNLKKRVSSYFNRKSYDNKKTKTLEKKENKIDKPIDDNR